MTETMHEWNAKIIEEFRNNEGRVGGPFEGVPMILVHHIGARTGTERISPLVYFPQDDGSMVIIASNGGEPTHPAWYHNLKANPSIEVEVGTDRFWVTATEVTDGDRDTIWEKAVARRPNFGVYQQQTTRTLPLLRLTR